MRSEIVSTRIGRVLIGSLIIVASCTAAPHISADGGIDAGSPLRMCGPLTVNIDTDVNNCGACGSGCAEGASCTDGTCHCPTGELPCEGVCINSDTDSNNCGGCHVVCQATATENATAATCVGGQCMLTCNAPYANCDADAGNGCETNTTDDPMHCGSCGTACPSRDECHACLHFRRVLHRLRHGILRLRPRHRQWLRVEHVVGPQQLWRLRPRLHRRPRRRGADLHERDVQLRLHDRGHRVRRCVREPDDGHRQLRAGAASSVTHKTSPRTPAPTERAPAPARPDGELLEHAPAGWVQRLRSTPTSTTAASADTRARSRTAHQRAPPVSAASAPAPRVMPTAT